MDGGRARPFAALVLASLILLPGAFHAGAAEDAVGFGFDPSPVPPSISPLSVGEPAGCGQGSWLAGSTEICGGEIVYRDYVYDDFGASLMPGAPPDLDFPFHPYSTPASFAYGAYPPVGGQQFVRDDGELNTTDIVAVRIRRGAGGLEVSVELNTLFEAAAPSPGSWPTPCSAHPRRSTGGTKWSTCRVTRRRTCARATCRTMGRCACGCWRLAPRMAPL